MLHPWRIERIIVHSKERTGPKDLFPNISELEKWNNALALFYKGSKRGPDLEEYLNTRVPRQKLFVLHAVHAIRWVWNLLNISLIKICLHRIWFVHSQFFQFAEIIWVPSNVLIHLIKLIFWVYLWYFVYG